MARSPRPRRPLPLPGRRTSLKHLAALTGFSITTVSMVLNGRAEEFAISPETRDLVLAAAREHHYQPNLHARSLRNRTTNLLGLVVPTLSNRFFGEMAETFERLARRERKLALVAVTDFDREEELDAVGYFLAQDVECVFSANPAAPADVAELCRRAGARHIVLDAPAGGQHTVSTDHRDASAVLTRALLASLAAAGRKGRVYYLGGMADHEVTRLRLAGFRAALRERGVRWSDDQFVETLFDPVSVHGKLELLFRNRRDIAGVFVNSLPALDGLVRYLARAPATSRALHYGVFDHDPIMDLLTDLPLAAVKQHPEQMMQKAFEIYDSPGAHRTGRIHYVPYELILSPAMRRLLPERRAQRS